LFALSYTGLGISMYPFIVPQSITIWQAASPRSSQLFMLVGVAVLIPLILGYTSWAYWYSAARSGPGAVIIDVRSPLARRRRHGCDGVIRPAALAGAQMRLSGHIRKSPKLPLFQRHIRIACH
jgi:hypothetical protein